MVGGGGGAASNNNIFDSIPAPAAGPSRLIFNTTPRRSSVDNSSSSSSNNNIPVNGISNGFGKMNMNGGGAGGSRFESARLVYYTSLGGKTSFSLFHNQTTIGRREDNHIVLHDAKISKYHAVIEKEDKR